MLEKQYLQDAAMKYKRLESWLNQFLLQKMLK